MSQENYAQFKLEDVFTPLFCYERKILEEGKIMYVEVDRTPRVTGIHAFDDFLRHLEAGQRSVSDIARLMGIDQRDLCGFIRLLTGMPAFQFISAYQMHAVCLLLRYTDMTAQEIANYFDLGTAANVAKRLQLAYGKTIRECRYGQRKKNDAGRFLLRMPGQE